MAHRGEEQHATTISTGATNIGISIPFSGRLVDAWNKADIQVERGEQIVQLDHATHGGHNTSD